MKLGWGLHSGLVSLPSVPQTGCTSDFYTLTGRTPGDLTASTPLCSTLHGSGWGAIHSSRTEVSSTTCTAQFTCTQGLLSAVLARHTNHKPCNFHHKHGTLGPRSGTTPPVTMLQLICVQYRHRFRVHIVHWLSVKQGFQCR